MTKSISLILYFLVVLSNAKCVDAQESCQCPSGLQKPVKESFNQNSLVFIGSVEKFGKSPYRPGMKEALVRVMNRYKGFEEVRGKTIYIYTPESSQRCGVNFLVNQDYLFYAEGNAARPVVTRCGRTQVLDNALPELDELQRLGTIKKGESLKLREVIPEED